MSIEYAGVDIAGATNTWLCRLVDAEGWPELVEPPRTMSLREIVDYVGSESVVSVAIDAPLTWALDEDRGLRGSDEALRRMLPSGSRDWVVSQNSLKAIPARGRQLTEYLGGVVGTILETHPRSCIYFALRESLELIHGYGRGKGAREAARPIWDAWVRRFSIRGGGAVEEVEEGTVDALVCATIAFLYHRAPGMLRRLTSPAPDLRGRGPFVVLDDAFRGLPW
ncbi:MAG: DUF429 domain-containing protein [Gemmatimonadota bacterium]